MIGDGPVYLRCDETLANFIKQSIQKGAKEGTKRARERTQV
jgi:hypothetical protein